MRFRNTLAVIAIGATAALGAGTASSRGLDPGANSLTVDAVTQIGDADYIVVGHIEAVNRKCAKGRRVQLQLRRESGFRTVDSARTSAQRAFGLRTDLSAEARVVAPAVKVKVRGRTVRCDRGTGSLRPDR